MKKYNIIYADPPWHYNDKRNKHPRLCGGAAAHYQTIKTKDLCRIPVQYICEDNCILFMWTTFPCLKDALEVMKAWGFKYKTLGFSWIKTNRKNGKPFFGIGYYSKSNCEVCLIGIKGRLKPVSNKVSSVVISPRQEHSKKPDCVRERIVELMGDLPRVELFARQTTEGWDCIGDGIDNRDIREVLNG